MSQEDPKLCLKCVVIEGSFVRVKAKLDARETLHFHIKSHLLEAHNIGEKVDAGKFLEFIFKKEHENDL